MIGIQPRVLIASTKTYSQRVEPTKHEHRTLYRIVFEVHDLGNAKLSAHLRDAFTSAYAK